MKKFFSLVLALVMALSLTTVAWGATSVANFGELKTAITNGDNDIVVTGKIILTEDLSLTNVTINTGSVEDAFEVGTGYTLTLGTGVTINAGNSILYANGGTININGATLKSTSTVNALGFAANGGTINMNSGSVTAYWTGLTASGANSKVNILDGTVESTNSNATLAKNNGTTTITGGVIKSGDDFATLWAKADGVLVVDGDAVISSETGAAISVESATATVSAGTFSGHLSATGTGSITVTGGTFDSDVSEYLATGLTQSANGTIVSAGGTALTATTYDLVTTDAAQVKTVGVTVNTYSAKAPKDTNKDGLLDQDGNVKYVEFSNMIGRYFVQVNTVGEADYTVYQTGTKTLFGYFNEVASPFYKGNGVPFTAFGDDCLEFDIEPVPGAKYYFFQGVVYKADPSFTSPINLMVGSTLTPVVAENVANWVQHVPAYTYDKDYKVVGVKCAECGTPAALYANFASVPKAAQGVALAIGDGQYYVWAAGPVADTETKVESAETFDAGIAMYVGMSVMAAAGSAVVIGKKKD